LTWRGPQRRARKEQILTIHSAGRASAT
jgi:hypothetical protein